MPAKITWEGFATDCKTQVCRLPEPLWLKLGELREAGIAILPILNNESNKEIEVLKQHIEVLEQQLIEKDKLLFEIRESLTLQREKIEQLSNQNQIEYVTEPNSEKVENTPTPEMLQTLKENIAKCSPEFQTKLYDWILNDLKLTSIDEVNSNRFKKIQSRVEQELEQLTSSIETVTESNNHPKPTVLNALRYLADNDDLEHSPEFDQAIDLLNQGQSFFLTGKAGTGKTTLLKHWISQTSKNVATVAPTGIAARNAGGVTIHSFFNLPPRLVTPDEIGRWKNSKRHEAVKRVDTIIIDECSMLLSPMVDNINISLQKNRDKTSPFGDVQMVFVGDLFQLPPIVSSHKGKKGKDGQVVNTVSEAELLKIWRYQTEFFFSAHTFEQLPINMIELQEVYRQSDNIYLDILNRVRIGQATQNDFDVLNQKLEPNFTIPKEEFYITLAPTNNLVAEANEDALAKLPGKQYHYHAEITGQFNEKDCPTETDLELKEGAQIMFIANHEEGLYVNGTMGKIVKLGENKIVVDIEDKGKHELDKTEWENQIYIWNEKERKLTFETIGTLTQFPVKLAYAVTVHKSQGMQFDKLIISSNQFFANGQLYVALSRCISLNGLVLKQPLSAKSMKVDNRVIEFMNTQKVV